MKKTAPLQEIGLFVGVNMLVIKDLAWDHREFKQLTGLVNVLAVRLSKLNILTKMTIKDNAVVFGYVSGEKIAQSKVDNRIVLAEGDPRIVKKGRNYLESKRLTKDQYDGLFNVINGVLNELGLNANVTLNSKMKSYTLRSGKTISVPPTQKSYPVAK
jgi:hypothetical protein